MTVFRAIPSTDGQHGVALDPEKGMGFTMASQPAGGVDLTELAIAKARAALRESNPDGALRWLAPVPTDERPKALKAGIRHSAARLAASNGEWHRCPAERTTPEVTDWGSRGAVCFVKPRIHHATRRNDGASSTLRS